MNREDRKELIRAAAIVELVSLKARQMMMSHFTMNSTAQLETKILGGQITVLEELITPTGLDANVPV